MLFGNMKSNGHTFKQTPLKLQVSTFQRDLFVPVFYGAMGGTQGFALVRQTLL